jgi:hypothetical protein
MFDNLPTVTDFQASALLNVAIAGNPNAKIPYVMEYNFGIQQQMTPNTNLEVNYVGSVSRHLWGVYAYNQPLPGKLGPNAIPNGQPFPFISGVIEADDNIFNANYNALQVQMERRYSQGLMFMAAYTYSKCLDVYGGDFDTWPQDTYDFAADYGRCDSDIKHLISFSSVYQLPFGRGNRFSGNVGRGMDTLIGGWNVSSIFSIHSGLPFSVTLPFDNANAGSTQRANYVPGCQLTPPGFKQNIVHWYNPACFVVPPPYTFGDTQRDAYSGPRYVDLDLALLKDFKIAGSKTIEVRFESYNFFNHTNLSIPQSSVATPVFMQILSAGPSREIQIAGKFVF